MMTLIGHFVSDKVNNFWPC